jgi:hypothetical protein
MAQVNSMVPCSCRALTLSLPACPSAQAGGLRVRQHVNPLKKVRAGAFAGLLWLQPAKHRSLRPPACLPACPLI